jgi:integrase
MRGHLRRRGRQSWEVKVETGPREADGRRQTQYHTVRGSRRDAERALTAILAELDNGSYVAPSTLTVAEYLTDWLDIARDRLAPKTAERYDEICRHQILPFLGAVQLQTLKPPQIEAWHRQLRTAGSAGGRPLAAQTVKHAHRVLHSALEHAVRTEILSRNPAHSVPTPKVRAPEMAIVEATEIESLFARLADHRLYPVVLLAFSTGARRGELLALRWSDLDLETGTVNIARSVEETREGLRVKPTKTEASRIIALPADAVAMLRDHRRRQSEDRFRLGLGAAGPRDLVFSDGGLILSPDTLSRDWWRAVTRLALPRLPFHAWRHTHASLLIGSGLDVVAVSRRLGHSTPATTLRVYAHLFNRTATDQAAARAIERALRPTGGSL